MVTRGEGIRAALVIRGERPGPRGDRPAGWRAPAHEWSYPRSCVAGGGHGVLLVRVRAHVWPCSLVIDQPRSLHTMQKHATGEERTMMRRRDRQTDYCRASGFVQLDKLGTLLAEAVHRPISSLHCRICTYDRLRPEMTSGSCVAMMTQMLS